jgi:hypothetical protein
VRPIHRPGTSAQAAPDELEVLVLVDEEDVEGVLELVAFEVEPEVEPEVDELAVSLEEEPLRLSVR